MRARARSRRRLRIGAILVTGAAIALSTVAIPPALGQSASPTEVVHVPDADQKLASPKVAAAIAAWVKKL
jgi:hypothetical protein